MNMPKKALVLGLDGGSMKLIEPWTKKGELPLFRKIMKKGVYGRLKSVRPPASVPAWPVIFKGKNPGKIGVFYFNWMDENYKFHYSNSSSFKGGNLWNFLNDGKYKVGVFNIPGTHPPEKVDGWMISELHSADEYTCPKKLKNEIPKKNLEDEKDPMKMAYKTFDGELDVLKMMISKKFDMIFAVFHLSDLSHQQKAWKKDVLKAYKKIDTELGKISSENEDDYNIFIVSDHGIQFKDENSSMFFVSTWLKNNNFLSMKGKEPGIRKSLFFKLSSKVRETFIRKKWSLPQRLLFLKKATPPLETFEYKNVDFSKTKVFPHIMEPFPSYCLYVNLKDRFSQGIVTREEYDKVRDGLVKALKRDGFKAFRKEELYSGGNLDKFPDVIVEHNGLISPNLHSKIFSSFKSGHSMDGIFMAYGPDMAEGKEVKEANLEDITPTILHTFNLPIPEDMDGRVLKEIFRKDSDLGKRQIKIRKIDKTETEKQRIKETLKRIKI